MRILMALFCNKSKMLLKNIYNRVAYGRMRSCLKVCMRSAFFHGNSR